MQTSGNFEKIRKNRKHKNGTTGKSSGKDKADTADRADRYRQGIVSRIAGGRCSVLSDGKTVECFLRKAIAERQQTELAVGDRVDYLPVGETAGRVERVHERTTTFSRQDPGNRHITRILAANMEYVVTVVAARNPDLHIRVIDRLVFAAEKGGAAPLICVNKLDLLSEAERQDLERRLEPYREIGIPLLYCSAETGEGLDELKTLISGKLCVFSGHSGVGKSSILNGILPDLQVRTNDTGKSTGRAGGKGRHTTTESTLYLLNDGTGIIDTPGVREFDTGEADSADLLRHFREFTPYTAECRLSGCTHTHEPECGVRDAVVRGLIPKHRYESYLKLSGAGTMQTAGNPEEHRQREEGSFTCAHCGNTVSLGTHGTEHRNHCPHCLWSLHLDNRPGDRSAFCRGQMEPVSLWVRDAEWVIIHRCTACGTLHSNRIAGDDCEGMLLSLAVKPLLKPPFSLELLELRRLR